METLKLFDEPRVQVTKGLYVWPGDFALPDEGTVLHELVTNSPAFIIVNNITLWVPDPSHLPRRELLIGGKPVQAVILRPPFTFLDRLLKAQQANDTNLVRQEFHEFTQWLHGNKEFQGAYGKLLEKCSSYRVPCVHAYNICHPAVPEGEVWVTFGQPNGSAHLMRFPTASDCALAKVTVKKVKGFHLPLILTNPKEYKENHGGDSDGDQSNVADDPTVTVPLQTVELPDMVYGLKVKPTEVVEGQKDTITVVKGLQAKKVVGLITWCAWGISAAHKQRLDSIDAYKEAWRFCGQLLELAFDGRKEGLEFDMSIIQALMGKCVLPQETAIALGCESLPETLTFAFSRMRTQGMDIWLRRFKGPLPTDPQRVVTALMQIWEGVYSYDKPEEL